MTKVMEVARTEWSFAFWGFNAGFTVVFTALSIIYGPVM